MLTLFWDEQGVILEHYMLRENTVTGATYADVKSCDMSLGDYFCVFGRIIVPYSFSSSSPGIVDCLRLLKTLLLFDMLWS